MSSTNRQNKKVRSAYNQNTMDKGVKIPAGIYIGVVVNDADPSKMGRVQVQVSRFYGTFPALDAGTNIDSELYLGAIWVMRMLPTGGLTQSGAGGGQNSYGMLGPPPSVGNTVIVAFGADLSSGVMLGVLPNPGKTENMAGPTVRETNDGTVTLATEDDKTRTSTNDKPPAHPQATAIAEQGLDRDRIRGLNFSSPNRDPVPRVTGISTPTGHSIALDDGSLEDNSNNSMRMRTGKGAQILMDDTNGLTYIVNRDGTSWIELNRNGDFDLYTKSGINMHTEGDFNIHCGGSFNLQTSRNINLQAMGAEGVLVAAPGGGVNIYALTNLNLQADSNGNLRVAGNMRVTAGRLDLNGPAALKASKPTSSQLAGNTGVTESIAGRVPEAEPWAGHQDVSVLDRRSSSGAASASDSNSYYYGTPTNDIARDDQTGNFDINNYPDNNQPGDLISWAPGVDKRVDPELLKLTEEVARRFGRPFVLKSGYRSPARNRKAKGAKRSQHMLGKAVDLGASQFTNAERLNIVAIASSIGIIGIGVYSSGNMHFDNRDGARAGWGDDFTSRSVPSYMVAVLNKHRAGGF